MNATTFLCHIAFLLAQVNHIYPHWGITTGYPSLSKKNTKRVSTATVLSQISVVFALAFPPQAYAVYATLHKKILLI